MLRIARNLIFRPIRLEGHYFRCFSTELNPEKEKRLRILELEIDVSFVKCHKMCF